MIELKVDEFKDGKVYFHIERQDKEDYERLSKSCSFEINGTKFFIVSSALPTFFIEEKYFFVRGIFKEKDYERIEVSMSEYLIIYELVKKYNEKFLDF